MHVNEHCIATFYSIKLAAVTLDVTYENCTSKTLYKQHMQLSSALSPHTSHM